MQPWWRKANALAVPNRPRCLPLATFRDGTSQTLLIGEKAMDPQNYTTGTWYWDEPLFTGGSEGTQRKGTAVLRDARGIAFQENWGAAHPGGALFLFADGSVRSLRFATPRPVVRALMTPDGGEVTDDT